MTEKRKLLCGEMIPETKILIEREYALPCDKRAVKRKKFPELFKILGTIYGEGDGETTFNLPGFKGYSIIVKDYE